MEVERKNTDGLRNELMDAPNLQAFLSANEANFSSESASMLLNEMLERKGISKASLAKQSGMSEIYLHQIFAGRRTDYKITFIVFGYTGKYFVVIRIDIFFRHTFTKKSAFTFGTAKAEYG